MKELRLHAHNPCPFVQPFLELYFRNGGGKLWRVDINGQIDDYLKNWTRIDDALYEKATQDPLSNLSCARFNWMSQATPLLQDMLVQLFENGWRVICISAYRGDAGPSHILRNAALFERVSIVCPEDPPVVEIPKGIQDISSYLPQILAAHKGDGS